MTKDSHFGDPINQKYTGGFKPHQLVVITSPLTTTTVCDEPVPQKICETWTVTPQPGERLVKDGVYRPRPFYRKNQRW